MTDKVAVFERLEEGLFRLHGPPPPWWGTLWPHASTDGCRLGEHFLYLEHFFFDAESVWNGDAPPKVESGPWAETGPEGEEYHLEATALVLGQSKILLITLLGVGGTERQAILQTSRENQLNYQRDLAAHEQLEEELQRKKEAAEALNKAKSEFLATMSHEIRTPMNGIMGMSEILMATSLTDEQQDYLGMIRRSADTLLQIINDILDLSKVEAGRLELESIPFSLRQLLEEMINPLAIRAHEKGLDLAFRIKPDVIDTVVGDPVRLRQVVVNLVGNALKFTSEGEVVLEMEPQDLAEDHVKIHVSVRDTGIGIPPEKQQAIFSSFAQADDSITRKYGGTGLGLTISKQLVAAMGGEIWVESAPGTGSTFHFTAVFGPALQHCQSLPELPQGKRLLVWPRSPTSGQILAEICDNLGLDAVLAADIDQIEALGREAIDQARPFDWLVLDCAAADRGEMGLAKRWARAPEWAASAVVVLLPINRREEIALVRRLGLGACGLNPVGPVRFRALLIEAHQAQQHGVQPILEPDQMPIFKPRAALDILLGEDNLVNQKLATHILQQWGHNVVVANNGREVVDATEKIRFDVILMDGQMPELDGFEATRIIRDREKELGGHIPIIALTAHAMKGDQERFIAVGMDDYVTKPIERRQLFKAIEAVTESSYGRTDEVLGGEPERLEPAAAQPVRGNAEIWARLLAHFDNDRALLEDMLDLFWQTSGSLLERVKEAGDNQDAAALQQTAHALKGAIGTTFGRGTAFEIAWQLEHMGEQNDAGPFAQVFAELDKELESLKEQLQPNVP